MNAVQRESVREILNEDGHSDPVEWLQEHGDDIPQVGICSKCGHYEWDCDPDTHHEYCTGCETSSCYDSILILFGII